MQFPPASRCETGASMAPGICGYPMDLRLPHGTLAVYPDAMTTEDQRLLFRAIRELEYLERRDRARELRARRASHPDGRWKTHKPRSVPSNRRQDGQCDEGGTQSPCRRDQPSCLYYQHGDPERLSTERPPGAPCLNPELPGFGGEHGLRCCPEQIGGCLRCGQLGAHPG